VRTKNGNELLYYRSKLVVTAKAFGLGAMDLVRVDYKDAEALRLESEEGRTLGFTGKVGVAQPRAQTNSPSKPSTLTRSRSSTAPLRHPTLVSNVLLHI
jgi:hypothetical protein